MTANQIAASGLVESNRHNTVTEEETERHNKATETIGEQANAINQFATTNHAEYEKKMAQLTEDYNYTYLKIQQATADEKERYQKELNAIQREQNDLTRKYNEANIDIQRQRNDLQEQQNIETRRHNENMEQISSEGNALQNKQIEYQNTYWVESNRIADQRLANDLQRIQKEYELGLINAEINSARNLLTKEANEINRSYYELEQQKWEVQESNVKADTRLKNSQKLKNYAGIPTEFLDLDIF